MLDREEKVYYPDSADAPMPEHDGMRRQWIATESALRYHFRERPDVYVTSNLFLYFVEGDPKKRVAPDVFVALGVPDRDRPNYKVWEEGKAPDVVFEFTSESSRFSDMGEKLGLYAALGVPEYYVFDPSGLYLRPSLRAFRLEEDVYREVRALGGLESPRLGLRLVVDGDRLRLAYPDGSPVPEDLVDASRSTEALRRRLEAEHARAESEHARAESEAARAESEAARARALQAEVDRLRARLGEA